MANSLETFRRLAQANLERDQLNRRVLQASAAAAAGSQSALAAAAVSLTTPGLTASDYMRFAMPVRDPDNGDAISGSGERESHNPAGAQFNSFVEISTDFSTGFST